MFSISVIILTFQFTINGIIASNIRSLQSVYRRYNWITIGKQIEIRSRTFKVAVLCANDGCNLSPSNGLFLSARGPPGGCPIKLIRFGEKWVDWNHEHPSY